MQFGHDEVDAREFSFALGIHGDPAPVITDLQGAVGVEYHLDLLGPAHHGLIHRVVHNLPQTVQEATPVIGADVHPRPLANGIKPLQHRQVAGGVAGLLSRSACRHGSG